MNKYKSYTIEDCLNDKRFRDWANAAEVDDIELREALQENPEVFQSFTIAKSFLIAVEEVQEKPLRDQKNRSLESTKQRINFEKHEKSDATWNDNYWVRYQWMLAASVLLVIGVVSWMFLGKNQIESSELLGKIKGELPIERVNNTAEIMEIKLNDGSIVKLFPNSSIKYKENFGASERSAYLSGKGYFDIQKDSLRPFTVFSKHLIVKVLGTSFTVNTLHLKTHSTVEVESGKVMVLTLDEFKKKGVGNPNLVLTPNQKIEFNPLTKVLLKGLVSNPIVISKTDEPNDFTFKNVSTDEVFQKLGESYGVSILFEKDHFENCSVTVPLGNEPLFRKLDIICQTIGATYNVIGSDIIISGGNCN